MSQEPREALLRAHLAAAVPLAIQRWADADKDARTARLEQALELIAEHGDDILFGGPHCRDGINALVDAVAILAYQPGGITIAGMHFEAKRPTHQETEVCAA